MTARRLTKAAGQGLLPRLRRSASCGIRGWERMVVSFIDSVTGHRRPERRRDVKSNFCVGEKNIHCFSQLGSTVPQRCDFAFLQSRCRFLP